MPSYFAWQIKPRDTRHRDLEQWIEPFLSLYKGLALILSLLRQSSDPVQLQAEQVAYQERLGGKTFQLLRVCVDPELAVFPEMSDNRYVTWVRFSTTDPELTPQPAHLHIDRQSAVTGKR